MFTKTFFHTSATLLGVFVGKSETKNRFCRVDRVIMYFNSVRSDHHKMLPCPRDSELYSHTRITIAINLIRCNVQCFRQACQNFYFCNKIVMYTFTKNTYLLNILSGWSNLPFCRQSIYCGYLRTK